MIKYDYSCDDCMVTVEFSHSIKETPDITCPKCDQNMRRELGSSTYIMVKCGTKFLGDVWDKQGIDFADPNYSKDVLARKKAAGLIGLSPEELAEKKAKAKKDGI